MYDKYRDLDKKTYELREVLIQAEKHRQDKFAQVMRINTDDEAAMQAIAGMLLQIPLYPKGIKSVRGDPSF